MTKAYMISLYWMVIEKQQPLTQWSGRLQSESLAQGFFVQVLVPASSGRENDWTPTGSSQVLPVPEGLEHSPLVSVVGPPFPVEVPVPTLCSPNWNTCPVGQLMGSGWGPIARERTVSFVVGFSPRLRARRWSIDSGPYLRKLSATSHCHN